MKRWKPVRMNARRVAFDDKRPPMVRLLQDRDNNGYVFIDYNQQWRTYWKAQDLGYVEDTENHPEKITQKGLDFLKKWEAKRATK